jgi:hypothetical protein
VAFAVVVRQWLSSIRRIFTNTLYSRKLCQQSVKVFSLSLCSLRHQYNSADGLGQRSVPRSHVKWPLISSRFKRRAITGGRKTQYCPLLVSYSRLNMASSSPQSVSPAFPILSSSIDPNTRSLRGAEHRFVPSTRGAKKSPLSGSSALGLTARLRK